VEELVLVVLPAPKYLPPAKVSRMQSNTKRAGNSTSKFALSNGPFNTLEITSDFDPEPLHFTGIGQGTRSNLQRRQASKYLTGALMLRLLELPTPNAEKYRDTFYCSHVVVQEGSQVKSSFCRKRWCIVCNRIRTAELVGRYFPTLQNWQAKQFVTLTVPNCQASDLVPTIQAMYKAFTKTKDNLRKNYSTKLVGIRKLEITYNRERNDYHPHFHLVTAENYSEQIISHWLRINKTAKIVAQDARPANDASTFELFKYFTKLTSNSSKDKTITAQALDTIFQAVQSTRTFQSFGFVPQVEVPTEEPEEIEVPTHVPTPEIFAWHKGSHDWLSTHGEVLAGTQVPAQILQKAHTIRTWI
jgi:hypothetical protein